MERKSRLEWERQRMQELSTQKSRLLEQINDVKISGESTGTWNCKVWMIRCKPVKRKSIKPIRIFK